MGLEPGGCGERRWLSLGWGRPLRAPRGGYRNPSGRRGRFLGWAGSALPPALLPLAARFFLVPARRVLAARSRAGKRAGLARGHGWLPLPGRVLLR